MIYTSFFSNLKYIPPEIKKVSIMRFTPEWSDKYIDEVRLDLAPKKEDLLAFKNDEISEEEFGKRYYKYISRIPIKKLRKELNNSVLLCSCKLGHFCHRHLLSKYLRSKKIVVQEHDTIDSLKDIKVEIVEEFSNKLCKKYPDKIFVFGDNLIKKGKKGQAIIRDNVNAFGVPTKKYPSNTVDSYFRDTLKDKLTVALRLVELRNQAYNGKTIVFPSSGIGTGLADMGQYCPSIFIWMNNFIEKNFLRFVVKESDKTRVIVAGSRKIKDEELVYKHIEEYLKKIKYPIIVSGMAVGPDKIAVKYAKENNIELEKYPANWDKYDKSAGYKRNVEMAEISDHLLVFWDEKSVGTKHMIDIAEKHKLKLKVIVIKKKKKSN